MGQDDYKELSSFVDRFVRRGRVVRGLEGLCLISLFLLLIIPLGLGIQEIKASFPYATVMYSVLTSIVALFLLGWTVLQLLRVVSRERAARNIEEQQPQLKNNLINSLQLYPLLLRPD